MEYSDFLSIWTVIERTQLFDESWTQSSHWLNVESRPMPCAWQYGDVSCACCIPAFDKKTRSKVNLGCLVTFSLPKAAETIIVLSQSDERYYEAVTSASRWKFDFKLFKKGVERVISTSELSYQLRRSSKLRVNLESGEYVVHVRLNRDLDKEKVSYYRRCH